MNHIVFAICGDVIWKSTDAGATFTNVFELNDDNLPFRELVFHPSNPNTIYASSDDVESNDGGAELFVSYNGGDTWNTLLSATAISALGVTPVERMDIAVTPAAPDRIYLGCVVTNTLRRILYWDGTAWHVITPTGLSGINWNKNAFAVSPINAARIYWGGVEMFRCDNFSTTAAVFTDISSQNIAAQNRLHADIRDLYIISESNNDWLLAGHDGGISISYNNGGTWTDINGQGLNITQFYGISVAQDYSAVVGGCQDLGLESINMAGGGNWTNNSPYADGARCLVDLYNPSVFYGQIWGGSQNGGSQLRLSNDAGLNWTANMGPTGVGVNLGHKYRRPLEMHRNGLLYTGHEQVFRRNQSNNWEQLGVIPLANPNSGDDLCALGLSAQSEAVIYAAFHLPPGTTSGVLWKTSNADAANPQDVVWEDITQNSILPQAFSYDGGRATAIAVDPDTANRLWVSVDRFARNYKVVFSENGGLTWINVSTGLPDYPVNDIIFQEGTTGVLYAATDVGVYINTEANNINSVWKCLNEGLPPSIVWDLDISYCKGKLVAGTFGRSAWEADIPIQPDVAKHISSTQTWDTERFLYTDLIIDPGVTLTIKSRVNIAKGRSITVSPGSKLVVHGGHLTNGCGEYWQGIVVEGNAAEHQFPLPNGSRHQGQLVLIDAVIENATCGASARSGGIITGSASSFVNNLTGVLFTPYQHIFNGVHFENLSRFTQCVFTINDMQPTDDNGATFEDHAYLDGVDGIEFQGCSFVNSKIHEQGDYSEQRGIGILAHNSGFRVEGYCTDIMLPCVHWENSAFTGLAIGVYADVLGNSVNTFKVDRCSFSDNQWGVLAYMVDNLSVTRCTIDVGSQSPSQTNNNPQGITIYGGTGFKVEGNSLKPYASAAMAGEAIGIFVIDAGEDDNSIYRNELKNLAYADLSNGVNGGKEQGLRYVCNQNLSNNFDFAVPHENNLAAGIATNQEGNIPTLSSGNMFTSIPLYEETHFYNQSLRPIRYFYYNSNSEIPVNYTINNVSPIISNTPNDCSSTLPSDNDDIADSEKNAIQSEIEALSGQLDSAKTALAAALDGGNTPQLLQQINAANHQNAAQLKADLLAVAPYLSEQALLALADRSDIFSDTEIQEIFIATPDESIDPRLLNYLEHKSDPMPSQLIQEIRDSVLSRFTARTDQIAGISTLSQARAANAYRLSHYLLTDTTGIDFDRLRDIWLEVNTISSAYARAESYLQQRDTAQAQAIFNQIPQLFNLEGEAYDEYNDLLRLNNIAVAGIRNGGDLKQAIQDSLAVVEYMISAGAGKAPIQAKAMLNYANGIQWYPPIVIPNGGSAPLSRSDAGTVLPAPLPKVASNKLVIIPNPASGQVTIRYALDLETTLAAIEITDMEGKISMLLPLSGYNGEINLVDSRLLPGIYTVRLLVEDIPVHIQRLVIVK